MISRRQYLVSLVSLLLAACAGDSTPTGPAPLAPREGVSAIAAPVSVPPQRDSFEDGPAIRQWTVSYPYGTLTGSIGRSTAVAHSGTHSVGFTSASGGQRAMGLERRLASASKGTFSIWFYDAAPNAQTLYEQFTLRSSTQPNVSATLGTQDYDAYCYTASLSDAAGNAFGPNANCGIYPQLSTTAVHRSVGWHLLSIRVGGDRTELSIDRVVVLSTRANLAFDTVSLNVFGPWWRPNTVAYYDDYSFTP